MKITKRIVTTEEVEGCARCEKREAEWNVGVSVYARKDDSRELGTPPEPFCTACRDIVLNSLARKRRPRKAKEGEPV